jgi:hypothetical protein
VSTIADAATDRIPTIEPVASLTYLQLLNAVDALNMAHDARMAEAARCGCGTDDVCARCHKLIVDALEFEFTARDLVAAVQPGAAQPSAYTVLTSAVNHYRLSHPAGEQR